MDSTMIDRPIVEPPTKKPLNLGNLFYVSDIVAGAVGQGIAVINGEKINYNEWLAAIGFRILGRQVQKNVPLPTIPLLTEGNIAAGIVTGVYASVVERKSNQQAVKVGVNAAIGNILGTELMARIGISDKAIL